MGVGPVFFLIAQLLEKLFQGGGVAVNVADDVVGFQLYYLWTITRENKIHPASVDHHSFPGT